jgi:hypothetical protein
MPKFDSPIGSKQFQGQPMREVSVPDESGYTPPPTPHLPRQVRQPVHDHAPPVFDERAFQEFQAQMNPVQPVREMSDVEQQILAAKRAKQEGKERISEGARRRIEMLIGMSQMSKTVDINGTTFTLKTLKNEEAREVLIASIPYDGTIEFSFENAKQTLARSLTEIAGTDINQFLSSSELSVRLDFISQLPQALFTRLYNEYVALDTESRDKFGLKNDADVKEVVEDLKK